MAAPEGRKPAIDWKLALGLAISAGLLYLGLRGLKLDEVWAALRTARYVWVVPGVFLYLGALVVRTVRWRLLLLPERKIRFRELLPTIAMGRGANNLFPFRTGEIVRLVLLHRRHGVHAGAGLASIVVERTFDGLAQILFLIVAVLLGGIPDIATEIGGHAVSFTLLVWLAVAVFVGALAAIYATVLFPRPVHRLAQWTIDRVVPQRFRARAGRLSTRFIDGFASVKSVWSMTAVLLCSIAVWSAEMAAYRVLMPAFGFEADLHELLIMSAVGQLGTALPSGPANIGTFDAPIIGALVSLNVTTQDVAASYQLVLHAMLWLTETLAGIWFMVRTGFRREELDRSRAEVMAELDNNRK